MLVLREYAIGDIDRCNSEEVVSPEEKFEYQYNEDYYLRTFFDTETDEVLSVGVVHKDGEIGNLINNSRIRKHKHKFYTLMIVFGAEAFAFIDATRLYTGMQDIPRNIRWIRDLGFTPADINEPEHAELGRVTYELQLTKWVQ